MNNISDIIEQFIINNIGEDDTLNLCRNELADFFNCAPSQINYVLNTRFTIGRGFLTESRRGGGGYIKIIKLDNKNDEMIDRLIDIVRNEIDFNNSQHILKNLLDNDLIGEETFNTLRCVLNKKSLSSPFKNNEDFLRANILKNVLINLKRGNRYDL